MIAVATLELVNVRNWMVTNRLSLNVEKTFAVLFTNRLNDVDHASKVRFDDTIISFCENVKFLGVTIDHRMSFGVHVRNICAKLSKSVGIFYKLRDCVPEHVLVKLYYSFVYPYLIYCNAIWGAASNIHINQLTLIKKSNQINYWSELSRTYGSLISQNQYFEGVRCTPISLSNRSL